MEIHTYHIHNVLKAYCQQLSQKKEGQKIYKKKDLYLSPQKKREALVHGIANDIFLKMKNLGDRLQGDIGTKSINSSDRDPHGTSINDTNPPPNQFTYQIIDYNQKRQTRYLILNDSSELLSPSNSHATESNLTIDIHYDDTSTP